MYYWLSSSSIYRLGGLIARPKDEVCTDATSGLVGCKAACWLVGCGVSLAVSVSSSSSSSFSLSASLKSLVHSCTGVFIRAFLKCLRLRRYVFPLHSTKYEHGVTRFQGSMLCYPVLSCKLGHCFSAAQVSWLSCYNN